MSGETDLTILLQQLDPQLNEGEFVFVTLEEAPDPQVVARALATRGYYADYGAQYR